MQNNNSKLNTVLLVIVIILLAIGIWMLAVNNKVSERIESDTETDVTEDLVVKEQEPEVVQPRSEPVDERVVFLKTFLDKFGSAIQPEIRECYYNGGHQFAVTYDGGGIADGGWNIYEAYISEVVENCGGFTAEPMPANSFCRVGLPTCTTIYKPAEQSHDSFGMPSISSGIDTYNID